MSRCKGCDVILTHKELSRFNESSGSPEDLCGNCGRIVFLDLNDIEIESKSYQFESLTENPIDYYNEDNY